MATPADPPGRQPAPPGRGGPRHTAGAEPFGTLVGAQLLWGLAQRGQRAQGILVAALGCEREVNTGFFYIARELHPSAVQHAQPVLGLEIARLSGAGVQRLGLAHVARLAQTIFGQDGQVEQRIAVAHLRQGFPHLASKGVVGHFELGISFVVAHGRVAQPVGAVAVLRKSARCGTCQQSRQGPGQLRCEPCRVHEGYQ